MIADLKPYPAMKNSGVPWLGEVPEHWEVVPLWAIARPKSVINQEDRALLSVYLGSGVIPFSEVKEKRTNVTSEDLSKYQTVDPGDFVLNNQQAWRGSVGVSGYKGIVSPAYLVLSLDSRIQSKFANFLFRDKAMVVQYLICSKGVGSIQRNLYWPFLKRAVTILPPLAEQAAIVRFLDHVDRRIRRYIRAKQKLIKLLEEQKQVIVHRAITRGLDSDISLKPSGLKWLLDIPSHWRCIPLKRLLSRIDYGTSEASKADGRIRVLTMGNIQKGEVTVPSSGGLDRVSDDLLLAHNDLLFTRTNGNPDLVGKVGIFRGQRSDNVSFASYLVRLRVERPNDPRWLHMLLNSASFWPFARSHALVNLQTNLNSTRYCQFSVPVPPPSQQIKILEGVANESQSLNTAIACAVRGIALLREYRNRLIADVVTGKLDVRAVAARLPAEADIEEPEPFEETEAESDLNAVSADELDALTEKAEA